MPVSTLTVVAFATAQVHPHTSSNVVDQHCDSVHQLPIAGCSRSRRTTHSDTCELMHRDRHFPIFIFRENLREAARRSGQLGREGIGPPPFSRLRAAARFSR